MKLKLLIVLTTALLLLAGCGLEEKDPLEGKVKVGVMLSENGLGDQSFSDLAFAGLTKARDEEGIVVEYLELAETGTYEKGFRELVESGNNLVFALGFTGQQELEKVALDFPDQKFVLVDAVSEAANITSITFKEDEGSMLAGIVAATVSKSQVIGFIGGMEVPVIQRFEKGFIQGAKLVNPAIVILNEYADNFDNDGLGAEIASKMIDNKADVLYAAAGFTGVGMLKEAEKRGIYAIGVDSDQYFYAEQAVITSMMKNIDSALFNIIHTYKESEAIQSGHIELGLAENAVGLAPFRGLELTDAEKGKLDALIEQAALEME
ncbi:BMP family ABC transporter substrate-binding protein [Sporosarcina sp. E16_3]|uniref:BMP family lipoprotein n=1 Tax=Sporosarcina sp. E16_3 TaxID=2789293 RepID=UPI001A929A7F|nr:BMP family ABC transporter substrate-binding protein [Sporosarcina sp. E16_3]MBO0603615.1 BMP family ABC transporter substrate-binding protein [Sporosarcina sp. E16_3]